MIDTANLIEYATSFRLGGYEIGTLKGTPPVYVERVAGDWVIRAEHPRSMNPHYFNRTKPHWRYKVGAAFATPIEAVESFNAWLEEKSRQ